VHSSKIITMSEFSVRWICIEISGVRNSLSPLIGEANFTFFGDLPELAEAEHLEPARVGEGSACPSHEAVQPAEAFDTVQAGAHHSGEGVGEHHFEAGFGKLGRAIAFTVP